MYVYKATITAVAAVSAFAALATISTISKETRMTPSWIVGDSNAAKLEKSPAWAGAYPDCRIYGTPKLLVKDARAGFVIDGGGVADKANFPPEWDLSGDGIIILGTNDLPVTSEDHWDISANLIDLASLIQRDLTDGRVWVCCVFPQYTTGGVLANEAKRGPTNAIVLAGSVNSGVSAFEVNGLVYPDDYTDFLHLNESGITKLVSAIAAL